MKRDIYQEVTNRIIGALEKGVGPWIRPWHVEREHRNAHSGRPYRGINVILLNLTAMTRGFVRPLWLTFREAGKLGGHVKKGEKGTTVVFWKVFEVEEKDKNGKPILDPETGEVKVKKVPFLRYYTVFNVEQCEGLSLKGEEPIQDTEFQPYELAERILSLPTVKYGGDRAYYDPVRDWIVLPPREAFRSSDAFYSVALHETTHWTGHETRLARQFGQRFGDLAYAFEELVAEMGSAFLCAQVGVELDGLQHPEYVASWLRVLKGDKRAIFTAAREAQKASDWLLDQVQGSSRNEAGVAAEIAA